MKNALEWKDECIYIQETYDSARAGTDPLHNFTGSPGSFMRYMYMQRDSATREGFHDSAQYIQHVIDDAESHGWRASW